MSDARYAIYFVPAATSSLYRFGAATIGYDCYDSLDVAAPDGLGTSPEDWHALTQEPRKYGFHATLKAPFRLHGDVDEAALIAACDRFATTYPTLPEFLAEVRLLAGFVAIMPRGDAPAVSELADACVGEFESFRAPLTAAERERRIAAGLSDQEAAYLDRWGYPYVFELFRFHMTLTGLLPGERRGAILSQLETRFARAHRGDRPLRIDRIALVRQADPSTRFVVLRQVLLGAAG